jgi:hypothetical protein
VPTDLFGVSGQMMPDAPPKGGTDLKEIAEFAKGPAKKEGSSDPGGTRQRSARRAWNGNGS